MKGQGLVQYVLIIVIVVVVVLVIQPNPELSQAISDIVHGIKPIDTQTGTLNIQSGGRLVNNDGQYSIVHDLPIKLGTERNIRVTFYIDRKQMLEQGIADDETIDGIAVFPTITAHLSGSNFDISEVPEVFSTEGEDKVFWEWTITPKELGEDFVLLLDVYTEISVTDSLGNISTASKRLVDKPIHLVYDVVDEYGITRRQKNIIKIVLAVVGLFGLAAIIRNFKIIIENIKSWFRKILELKKVKRLTKDK